MSINAVTQTAITYVVNINNTITIWAIVTKKRINYVPACKTNKKSNTLLSMNIIRVEIVFLNFYNS